MTLTVSAVEADRRAYRRRQSTRSVLIAATSTLVVAALLVAFAATSPGWAIAQRTFFDPVEAVRVLPAVFTGLLVNLTVLVFAVLGVAIVATLLAVLRTTRTPVLAPFRFLAAAYTDVLRGVPLIVVIYLVGFGIPALNLFPLIDTRILGCIALIVTYSAYVAEVLRAGIE